MKLGILLIGSLCWDEDESRTKWRRRHLKAGSEKRIQVGIKYARPASSRNCTYTMCFDAGSTGTALVIESSRDIDGLDGLFSEAEALWAAERRKPPSPSISADWGCVGFLFRDSPPAEWLSSWCDRYKMFQASPPVDEMGILRINWPRTTTGQPLDFDILMATATRGDVPPPTSEQIADAWVNRGSEEYFFNNVLHEIRTQDDVAIWHRVEARAPRWLEMGHYLDAIQKLRREQEAG